MRLAGKNKTARQFFRFQSVVDIHGYFSFHQFGTAGATYATFAGVWEVGALLQSGVQYGFFIVAEIEIKTYAIEPYGDLALAWLSFLLASLMATGVDWPGEENNSK